MSMPKLIALLVVPVYVVLIAVLEALDIRTVFEPPLLLGTLNTLFLGIVPFAIAYVAARVYFLAGSSSILLVGCGMLIYGLSAIAAGWLIGMRGAPNINVTIFNTGALVGALFQLVGSIWNLVGRTTTDRRGTGTGVVVGAYGCISIFVVIFTVATVKGLVPLFFIQDVGPTALRQVVLGTAVSFFLLASALFMYRYWQWKSDFIYWYSLALALIGIGLCAVFLQRSVGSPIGWLGRSAQYLGGLFALAAVVTAARGARSKGLTIERIIANFFADAEASYRSLVETARDAIISFDQEDRIIGWNSAAEAMFGYTKGDAIGSPFFDLLIPERHAPVLKDEIGSLMAKPKKPPSGRSIEIEGKRRDGSLFAAEVSVSGRKLPTGWASTCIVRDIAERKRAEDNLRTAQRFSEMVVDSLPGMFYIFEKEGRVIRRNSNLEKVSGYSSSEISKMHPLDFFSGEDKQIVGEAIKKAFAVGENSVEAHVVSKDGTRTPYFFTGKMITLDQKPYMIGVGIDITDRKRAEESLRTAEEMLRSILRASPVAIVLAQDRKIRWANDAWEKMFGIENKEDYVGHPTRMMHSSQQQYEHVRKILYDCLAAGGVSEAEAKLMRKDGTLFDARIRINILDPSESSKRTISAISDITEQKRADKTISRQGALLSAINFLLMESLQSATEASIARACLRMAEEITGSGFGFIGEVNQAGRVDTIALSRPAWEACRIPKSEASLLINNMEIRGIWSSVLRTEQSQIINEPASHPDSVGVPDGHPTLKSFLGVPLKRLGKTFGLIAIANKEGGYNASDLEDVEALSVVFIEALDRKRAEVELRNSEQRYRSLFEASIDGIYITARDGTLIDANQAYLDLFGYSREEVIERSVLITYADPADRNRYVSDIEQIGSVRDYLLRLRKKNGTEMDCLSTATVRRDRDGTILGYRGIVRDVTEQRNLQKQLLQAQKMEAVGTLAGGIAHDFNNLLTVVLGFSELLLADKGENDPEYEDLQKIHYAAKSGAELVQRLLAFGRKAEPRPVPMNLNVHITQIESLLRRTIPRMIEIQLELSADLPEIHADPSQMEQVLMNLAVNARDAMPDGGKLTLTTKAATLDEEYCRLHVKTEPGEYVMLSVSDTGHGIDKETLEHLFEPFYTTKEMGRGTGLGLAIVYGIVKQHDGHITCYSEVGRGSTFNVYLPAMPSEVKAEVETTGPMPASGTETILLVDDEEFVRDLGARILTKNGYTVLQAVDGKEALDVFKKEGSQISLVILDLIMPEMGGKDCLAELLKINPQVKVLISSGYSADASLRETIEAGARGFVKKPFRVNDLLRDVRRVLDER